MAHRFTPSHSRKNGKRLRQNLSRRLVTERRRKHPDAWRLPARGLETGIARILCAHLSRPTTLIDLVKDLSASELPALQEKLNQISVGCVPDDKAESWAPLLQRADLSQGSITLRLDRKELADRLGLTPDRPHPHDRGIAAPFRMRRRGIEAKIIIGTAAPQIDPVLVKNILTARRWYEAIKAGASFSALAAREHTTTGQIRQMIGLAFLAPELSDRIVEGTQPPAFTSEWFKHRQLPAEWNAQREIIAAL
ncbi:MAG: hypothetical protein D6801_06685 [Alphaproteobacteria bacterium]|nr:MAG: hypothetical protein D6801_06685 [Alphaproteobacteria bacterium]